MEFEEKSIHKRMSISPHYSNIWFNYWGPLSIKGRSDSRSDRGLSTKEENFTEGFKVPGKVQIWSHWDITPLRGKWSYLSWEVKLMSKVAELLQSSKTYASQESRFTKQETGCDSPKPVRRWFQTHNILSPLINGSHKEELRYPLEDKAQCSLLHWQWSFWPITYSPNSDIPDLHGVKGAALGIGALPPVTLKATLRWESRKMKEKQKWKEICSVIKKSLIWWKPQTRVRIKESGGQRLRSKEMG